MLANSSYRQHSATEQVLVDDWIRSVIALFDVAGQHLTSVQQSARVTQHCYFKTACSALRKYEGILTVLTCKSTGGGQGDYPLWDGQIIDATLPP
jgi:hypothetical protein